MSYVVNELEDAIEIISCIAIGDVQSKEDLLHLWNIREEIMKVVERQTDESG